MAYKAGKEIFYSVLELSLALNVTSVTIRRRIKAAGLEDVRGRGGRFLLTAGEVARVFKDRFTREEVKVLLSRLPVEPYVEQPIN